MQNNLISLEKVVGPDGSFDPSNLWSYPEANDYLKALAGAGVITVANGGNKKAKIIPANGKLDDIFMGANGEGNLAQYAVHDAAPEQGNRSAQAGLDTIVAEPYVPAGELATTPTGNTIYVPGIGASLEESKILRVLGFLKGLKAYNAAATSIAQAWKSQILTHANILELKGVYALGKQIESNPELYELINEEVKRKEGKSLGDFSPTEKISVIGETVAAFLTLPEIIDIKQEAMADTARAITKQTTGMQRAAQYARAVGGSEGIELYQENLSLQAKVLPLNRQRAHIENTGKFIDAWGAVEKPIAYVAGGTASVVASTATWYVRANAMLAQAIGMVTGDYPVQVVGGAVAEGAYLYGVFAHAPAITRIFGETPSDGMYIAGGLLAFTVGMILPTIAYKAVGGIIRKLSGSNKGQEENSQLGADTSVAMITQAEG